VEREELEKMSREYNMVQEQLQSLTLQKEQFAERKQEYKEAMQEIERASGKIYFAIGGAIVEVEKAYAVNGIKEKEEVADMRISIVKKQQDEISKKEQSLRSEISTALKDFKG
jgi:prefoldin beta subunit